MKITFNTNRLYTTEGQVITAEYDDMTESAKFNDHSRMIAGYIEYIPMPRSAYDLQELIMHAYDANQYVDDSTSRKLERDHHATHLK